MNPSLPSVHLLPCPPFGNLPVNFDVSEFDEEELAEYSITPLSGDITTVALDEAVDNWTAIWESTSSAIEKLLLSDEKDHTLEEIVSDPRNTINVEIMHPEEGGEEKYRLGVSIDVKTDHGSFVYSAEFVGLEFVDSSATF